MRAAFPRKIRREIAVARATRKWKTPWRIAVMASIAALCAAAVSETGRAQQSETVSLEQNKALVRRWIDEGFNKKNLNVLAEIFAEDFAVNGQRIGRAGLRQSMSRFQTAFPDLHVTITEIVAEGDKVVIWYTVRATHKGEFESIPPTGKVVNWYGSDLLRITRGQIVEGRFIDDSIGLLRQLGATVAPR